MVNPISTSEGPFLQLPEELLFNIFSRLNIVDLQHLLCASKVSQRIADGELLREKIFKRDFSPRKQLEAIFIKTLLEKRNKINLDPSWKNQYKYLYQFSKNLEEDYCKRGYRLFKHESSITCLKIKHQYLFSGSKEGKVVIHHLYDQNWTDKTLPSDEGYFSLNDDYFISSQEECLFVWSFWNEDFKNVQTLTCGSSEILSFRLEKEYLCANNAEGLFKVWKSESNRGFKVIFVLDSVRCFYFKKEYLFTVDFNGSLTIWKQDQKGEYEVLQKIENAAPANSQHYSVRF